MAKEQTYKVTFYRRLTGERGDVSDVKLSTPLKAKGLTIEEAHELKYALDDARFVATDFFVVPEEED